MANEAFRIDSFSQGLTEVSATKRAMAGQYRLLPDGRAFRYGKSAGAIVAGSACTMAEAVADHFAQVQTGYTNAVGSTTVSVLVTGAGTAVTANQYDDGYLQMYDGAAGTVGRQYQIDSHTTGASSSVAITVQLRDPLVVATIATDTFSLIPNPWSLVIENAGTKEKNFAGVAMAAASGAGYWLWFQTHGPAIVKGEATPAVGSALGISDTAKELEIAAAYTDSIVGQVWEIAQVADKWTPVFLKLD